jgi:hypothetical protein
MDGSFDLGHNICRNVAHTVVLLGMLGDFLHYLVLSFATSDGCYDSRNRRVPRWNKCC